MTETSDLPIDPTDPSDTESGSGEELGLAGPGAGLSSVDGDRESSAGPAEDLAGPN